MRSSSKKLDIANLYLASILKYEGTKKIKTNLVKDWTFITYVIVSKDENKKYFNILNNDEKYSKMRHESQVDIDDEAIDVIANANIVLKSVKSRVSSKEIIEAMQNSGLYFRDILDNEYNLSNNKKMIKTR